MKQVALNLNLNLKKTRKREFLEQMEQVVPWAALVELIAPYYPQGRTGRPPFSLQTMLRVHFMQQWFTLSDPGMEEAFFDTPLLREFAQLEELARLPDESTILRFRHRLEKHKLAEQILATVNELLIQRGLLLKAGTVVDATLIAAPTSTKNKDKVRDPDMHSSKKGNQRYFGMKAHIGADAESGLVHTVRGISGHVASGAPQACQARCRLLFVGPGLVQRGTEFVAFQPHQHIALAYLCTLNRSHQQHTPCEGAAHIHARLGHHPTRELQRSHQRTFEDTDTWDGRRTHRPSGVT